MKHDWRVLHAAAGSTRSVWQAPLTAPMEPEDQKLRECRESLWKIRDAARTAEEHLEDDSYCRRVQELYRKTRSFLHGVPEEDVREGFEHLHEAVVPMECSLGEICRLVDQAFVMPETSQMSAVVVLIQSINEEILRRIGGAIPVLVLQQRVFGRGGMDYVMPQCPPVTVIMVLILLHITWFTYKFKRAEKLSEGVDAEVDDPEEEEEEEEEEDNAYGAFEAFEAENWQPVACH